MNQTYCIDCRQVVEHDHIANHHKTRIVAHPDYEKDTKGIQQAADLRTSLTSQDIAVVGAIIKNIKPVIG